jgi:hypothetical protein
VKERGDSYALAAGTESRTKSAITLRTSDDNEVGTLTFDYTAGALILEVTGQISANRVQEAEIQTGDGRTLPARISVEGKNRLVLLRKAKVFPKDVSMVTLSMAE